MSVDYLPPLEDPSEFESLCLDLWREIWGPASDAQKNGRSGQPQAGVDVFGRDGADWVGVQCKKRSAQLYSKLSVKEFDREVDRARGFKPSLSLFIVAMTGKRDGAVQERARMISEGGFRVAVWSWDELWEAIRDRPELLRRIGPRYWPSIWSTLHASPGEGTRNVSVGPGGIAVGGDVHGDVTIHYHPPSASQPADRPQKVAPSRLTHVAEVLIGRDNERAALDAFWADPEVRVVTLVAWAGVGKTSLVGKWAAEKDLGGADYYDWSFYVQGTQEEGSVSGKPFLEAALRFFGGEDGEKLAGSAYSADKSWDLGAGLAFFLARRKTLLILDGLETLQDRPSSPQAGKLRDLGLVALLRGLAANNPGLCVVTSRESVKDLVAFREKSAPEWKLDKLSTKDGVKLLERFGIRGYQREKESLVKKVEGHALTLSLLGAYLRDAYGGDIGKLDLVDLSEADRDEQGGHAFRAIAAYERWFLGEGKDKGARELAVLRLLGLFDRPADWFSLKIIRKGPAIPGLTEPIVGLSDGQWNVVVSRLVERGLVSAKDESLDTHPLIRGYFASQLCKEPAWVIAHGILFEHFRDVDVKTDTFEGLQRLYQAVAHGCHAGRYQEACDDIFRDRIVARFNVLRNFGSFSSDLGAVACFFNIPWSLITEHLTNDAKAWLMTWAASSLRALGRQKESDALFADAVKIPTEGQSAYPQRFSLQGYQYYDLLLAEVESEATKVGGTETVRDEIFEAIREVEKKAAESIRLAESETSDLELALGHLALGRVTLYRSILEHSAPVKVGDELEEALKGIRRLGRLEELPMALIARAWLFAREDLPEEAKTDLKEAEEIATQGQMPLFLADIALYRARLFGDQAALKTARELIEKHGYGRRLGELLDAEGAQERGSE